MRDRANRRARWLGLLAAVVAIWPTTIQPAATAPAPKARASFTTMEIFWRYCDLRQRDEAAKTWCLGYVLGHVDASISLGNYIGKEPLCLTADSVQATFNRIISFVPSGVRGQQDAGAYVQAAILRALRCD